MTTRTVETYFTQHVVFSPDRAAALARVSVEFVRRCEREDLIPAQTTIGDKTGFLRTAVCDLMRVRHLHEDLGLDLEAVDFIMRMRRRVMDLERQLQENEQRMIAREEAFLTEIRDLRLQLTERGPATDSDQR